MHSGPTSTTPSSRRNPTARSFEDVDELAELQMLEQRLRVKLPAEKPIW
ncbi:hypothetical protein [Thermoanaerobacterium sp. DL9XJH110]